MSRHFLSRLLLSTVSLFSVVSITQPAIAADPLSPRVEVSAKGGNKRSILSTQIWAPLAQRDDRVLYADLRLMGDNDENREGNFGLGYREINPYTNTVIGFHGWYDQRRTENDSTFRQLTFGAESLGHVWDMRVNGYIPLNSGRVFDPGTATVSNPYLAGTGIFYDINGLLVETPQYGVDGEVGYRLPVLQDRADAIRIFGGGYHFFRDNTDNVTGFRIRTEAQVNSAFSLGARYQYDEPRGSQGFLEATIRFPFGAKKLYQETGLRSRLDESAERDVDIVTSAKAAPTKIAAARNEAGTVQRILYVDNTAATGGDGSLDNPFATLKDAEASLKAHDILYVNHGDGTTTGMDQGIVIDKANISLIGSGSDLSYAGHTLIAAGLAPVITNTDAFIDDGKGIGTSPTGNGILVTGSNATLSGLTISDTAATAIYILADGNGHTIQNTLIDNVAAGDSVFGRGIFVNAWNGGQIENIAITNSTFTDNMSSHGRGLEIRAQNTQSRISSVTIHNNQITGNSSYQTFIYGNAGGSIQNIQVSENTVTGHSTSTGVYGYANGAGSSLINMTLNNNTISNSQTGISLYSNNNALLSQTTLSSNIISDNSGGGIQSSSGTNGTTDQLNILDNTVNNNASYGIQIHANSVGASLYAVLDGNTTQGNGTYGIAAYAGQDSAIIASISNSTISGNATTGNFDGIRIDNDSTGLFNIDLGGGSLGSVGGNRIYGNLYRDVFIDSRPGTAATTPGSIIFAQNNWWGVGTGLDQATRATFDNGSASPGSSIDAGNHLTSDPAL